MVLKDEGGFSVKIISASNVPGCVPGVVPAANVICGISKETLPTASVVSHAPVWNLDLDFRAASKKDCILFIIRDGDQILGSLQLPLKDVALGVVSTHTVEMMNGSTCSLSFSVTSNESRSSVTRKRLLITTKKLKETVLSRFGSDTAINAPSDSAAPKARTVPRPLQRCHSYVNERSKLTRNPHQYVNCGKQRSCGELGKNVDLAALRSRHQNSVSLGSSKTVLVLIQGRNLGTCKTDIISVHVGGLDCTDDVQHYSSEKLLVRLPRDAALSPVSVVTKSGGIGQQNAKVKVTFESASSSDEIRSIKRSELEMESSSSLPRVRNRQIRTSGAYSTGGSDSGSDNMCVNTRTFVPPPRKRIPSSSCSSLASTPDTAAKNRSRLAIMPAVIASDIIAPPASFSEGSTPVPRCGEEDLLDLPKMDLVDEIYRLRNVVTSLQSLQVAKR